jgi:hypothetical protein
MDKSTLRSKPGKIFSVLSPRGLLGLTLISYFYILATTDFESTGAQLHFFVLGLLTLAFTIRLFSVSLPVVSMTREQAGRLLRGVLLIYLPLSVFLGSVTGWSLSALIDARFSIPAYGFVFSLFFVGAILGFSAVLSHSFKFYSLVFFVLFLYVGFVAGGKGFFVPAVFAFSFAALTKQYKPNNRVILFLLSFAAFSIFAVVYSLLEDFGLVIAAVFARIALQSDSLSWVSAMNNRDFDSFPITVSTFLYDLVGRFIGLRINELSVGAEIAHVVSGDDSGGGPNPTLPVLSYAVNHANIFGSVLMVIAVMTVVLKFMRWAFTKAHLALFKGQNGIFYAALVFLAPTAVIDVVLYLQQIFCLCLFAIASNFYKNKSRKPPI